MTDRSIRSARQIGPFGTLARVLGGLAAIIIPIELAGFTATEALIGLVGLTLVALAAGIAIQEGVSRWAPGALRSQHAICSVPGCTLVAVLIIANAAMVAPTTANGNVTIWVWLGASMLVAAARGYGGCEVLAIPNLLTRRHDQIGCLLYTPIDRAEASRQRHTATNRPAGVPHSRARPGGTSPERESHY